MVHLPSNSTWPPNDLRLSRAATPERSQTQFYHKKNGGDGCSRLLGGATLRPGHHVIGEHPEKGYPRTDFLTVLLGHHPCDLGDVP